MDYIKFCKKCQYCDMAELSETDILLKNLIAKRIKFLRESTGLSQSEFAHHHEIDRQHLHRWENATSKRGVNIYTIKKFCQMMNITLEDFFDKTIFSK